MTEKLAKIETLDDLIGLWETEAEFARESELKPSHLAVFKVRLSVPTTYWPGIIAAAQRRAAVETDPKKKRLFQSVNADVLLGIQVRMAEQRTA